MSDASRASDEGAFNRCAAPQLVGRYEEIKAAAIALAYAARPRGIFMGSVDYWCTLPGTAQSVHMLRAIHDTASALRIPLR